MAQEQENVQIIQRVLSAIGQGDLDGVLSSMSEEVQIYFPGPATVPFTGTYRGHAGVGQFAKALGENVVDGSAEVRQVVAQTVRNGKVAQLQEF
jgi:ketosteroid isomerase-like protein